MLNVHSDIILNEDKGKATAIILLKQSAAFDTIDQTLPIKRISIWYGISGTTFPRVASYIANKLKIADCFLIKYIFLVMLFPNALFMETFYLLRPLLHSAP